MASTEPTRRSLRTRADGQPRLYVLIFTLTFWEYALERVLKTFAQTFAALLTLAGVGEILAAGDLEQLGAVIYGIPWLLILIASAVSALFSLLTAIVSYSRPPREVEVYDSGEEEPSPPDSSPPAA